jgi:hypothetical protein
MSERLDGDGFRTELEHLEDTFPLGDLAKLLELLMRDNGLSVKNGSKDLVFNNPATVGILEKMLTDKLKEKVFRSGKALVIHKGDGRDGNYIIPGNPPGHEGFSISEVSAIIDAEKQFSMRKKDLEGKKMKGSKSRTHTDDLRAWIGHPSTRGEKATGLFRHIEQYEMEPVAECCFLFDYLWICQVLPFTNDPQKGFEDWDNKDKYNYIKKLVR